MRNVAVFILEGSEKLGFPWENEIVVTGTGNTHTQKHRKETEIWAKRVGKWNSDKLLGWERGCIPPCTLILERIQWPYLLISDSISLSFASRSLLHASSSFSRFLCNKSYSESFFGINF